MSYTWKLAGALALLLATPALAQPPSGESTANPPVTVSPAVPNVPPGTSNATGETTGVPPSNYAGSPTAPKTGATTNTDQKIIPQGGIGRMPPNVAPPDQLRPGAPPPR